MHPPPAPLEDVVDDGLMAIQRAIFLRKAGVETVVDDVFLLNLPSRDDLLESAIKSITRCVHLFLLFVIFFFLELLLHFIYEGVIVEMGLYSF